jgi:hypothetical protein
VKRVIAPLVVAGVLVAGCGHPLIPASALGQHQIVNEYHPPLLSIPYAKYKVKRPILGVDLYAPRNYSASQTSTDGLRTISYIKNVLHATSVGIVWDFYAPSRTSNVIRASKNNTLSVANLITLTKLAKQHGLQVEYRPLIFISSKLVSTPKKNTWEGEISPSNRQKWFNSYFNVERPYIVAAQKLHISEIVAETEMHRLNGSSLWSSFFRRVGRIYHGVVSYTAFYQDYLLPRGHLLPVRLYGVDMYKGLNLNYGASVAQVTAAWEKIFSVMPTAVRERTALDEEGLAASVGAYRKPSDLSGTGRLDQTVQANWFTAACRTVARYHMRAIYFFKVNLADYPATPTKALSVFEGRKGAVAISACAKLFR